MNRQQKDNVVQDISQKFQSNQAAFVVRCQGLTMAELHTLRTNLATKNSELKVAKNRLAKLAMKDHADCNTLIPSMKGQTAIVFAKSDFTSVAKVLHDFSKKHEALEIVAGCCESQLFDKQGVIALAKVPSREVLLSRLCGVLKAPVVKVAWILSQVSAQKSGTTATQESV